MPPFDPRDRLRVDRDHRGGRSFERWDRRHHRPSRRDPAARGRVRLVRGGEAPAGWFWQTVGAGAGLPRGDRAMLLFAPTPIRATRRRSSPLRRRARRKNRSTSSASSRGRRWSPLGATGSASRFPRTRVAGRSLERVNQTRVGVGRDRERSVHPHDAAAYETVGTHEAVKESRRRGPGAGAGVRAARAGHLPGARTGVHDRRGCIAVWGDHRRVVQESGDRRASTLPPIPWLRRPAPYLMWLPSLAVARTAPVVGVARHRMGTRDRDHLSGSLEHGRIGPKARRCVTRCCIRSERA